MTVLFYTRLGLYMLAFLLPVLHPAIPVPYDRPGWWLWFGLLPGEMLIAYYLSPPRFRLRVWLLAGAGLIALSILAVSGFSSYALPYLGVGVGAFLLTALVFKTGVWGRGIAVLEPFALAFLYTKLLAFSRSSEESALQSAAITQVLLVLGVVAFLLHGLVLYLAAFHRPGEKRGLRAVPLFLGIAVPVVLLIALVLPPDFVKHSVVLNQLGDEPRPKPYPLDLDSDGLPGGNLRSRQQWEEWMRRFGPGGDGQMGDQPGEGDQGQGVLEGIPSDEWQDGQGTGGTGQNRQYAVMVVASSRQPVYAADGYFEEFHPERGFIFSREHPLNELHYLRLLETWRNPELNRDRRRSAQDIFILSTVPERFLAYRPEQVEPTILDRKYHPFSYSYRYTSLVSAGRAADWHSLRGLSAAEKQALAPYLSIDLPEARRSTFEGYLRQAIGNRTGYYEKLLAIMESFSTFQYEVGFDDDVSTAQMERFLATVRRGDCTEFSNSTAILARMAGLPTRVVTGYLASRGLQNMAHLQGLFVLRQRIPALQEIPFQDLLLVTSAHRHSWLQVYMPGYGWVDFDPTTYAIPPTGSGDPNSMNVVIPLIQELQNPSTFRFPWTLVLRGLAILVFTGLLGTYLYRFGREAYLWRVSAGRGPRAQRALYTLLLMRLAANGRALKSPAQTALEYAGREPTLRRFAAQYTTLRYRERYRPGERENLAARMRGSYREATREARRPGLKGLLRRIFSLKGLYY